MTADSAGIPFQGRTLPSAAFAGDDGQPDPELARSAGPAGRPIRSTRWPWCRALAAARLFVAVVAVADEGAHMALMTVTGVDGRRALPVFTQSGRTAALAAGRPTGAGPRRSGRRCPRSPRAATCSTWTRPGRFRYLVRRPAVWCLGRGLTWLPSYADPAVAQEISALCDGSGAARALRARRRAPSSGSCWECRRVWPRTRSAAVVAGFERAISRSERVAECVDSLELTLRSLEEPTGHR